MTVRTPSGTVTAARVVLATNAFRPLLARLRFHTVPVYDYVLATEPLTAEQLAAVGWRDRMGISDSGNQFHYYRLTADDRILWGGYDAIYHFGRRIDPALDDRRATHRLLAEQFYETFPQLRGVRFTHRWGGVIDTCTRFCAFFGSALRGRAAYAMGFTGLGVGASRFAADVMLDLLDGARTERTRLRMVRRKPLPFPPEPLAYIGIQLTRWSLARADRTGRATSGCGRSTASASASTADPSTSRRHPREDHHPARSARARRRRRGARAHARRRRPRRRPVHRRRRAAAPWHWSGCRTTRTASTASCRRSRGTSRGRGYTAVIQDVRGKFRSGGETEFGLHEVDDGFDTLEWIAAQPWCDGRVRHVGRLLLRHDAAGRRGERPPGAGRDLAPRSPAPGSAAT